MFFVPKVTEDPKREGIYLKNAFEKSDFCIHQKLLILAKSFPLTSFQKALCPKQRNWLQQVI